MWPTLRSTAAAKSCSGEAIRKLSGLPATQTKLAILFPGQGAQKAGMGADLLEAFPYTKHVADSIDQALGYFLSRRMVNHEVSFSSRGLALDFNAKLTGIPRGHKADAASHAPAQRDAA